MSTSPATIADLLGYLPALSKAQVSKIVVAAAPPDGDYLVELDDALGEFTASGSTQVDVRDDLASDLQTTELATVEPLGDSMIKLTGAQLGVAFEIALTSPTDGATLTTTAAFGVPEPTIAKYLALASKLVSNTCMWGELLSDGQALRALHEMDAAGILELYGVPTQGEVGVLVSSALGPSSSSYAAPVGSPGAESVFSTTKFGRAYYRLFRSVMPYAAALLDSSDPGDSCL